MDLTQHRPPTHRSTRKETTMQVKPIARGIAALFITAAAAAPAFAATSLTVNSYSDGFDWTWIKDSTLPDETTLSDRTVGHFKAGRVNVTWDNGSGPVSFNTYCADIYKSATVPGGPYLDYTVAAPSAANFGANAAAKANAIGRLLTSFGAQATGNATKSAALQYAVWEIINEKSSNAYDVDTGDFKVTLAKLSDDATLDPAALGWADTYLTTMGATSLYDVKVLQGVDHQNFLLLTPVPEPETYAMFLAGLGMMGFVARRRAARG